MMGTKIRLEIVVALLILYPVFSLLPSCGSSLNEEKYGAKWGVLNEVPRLPGVLLSLKPDSKVCLLGYKPEVAVQAINQWTKAIGRDSRLKIEANCSDGHRKINIIGPDKAGCTGGGGHTNTIDSITVCRTYTDGELLQVILHETGHMWGLCDQYRGGQNCAAGVGQIKEGTVMDAIYEGRPVTKLTDDDIAGIKYITSQPQWGANADWLRLKSQTPTPAPSTQPPAGRGTNAPATGSSGTGLPGLGSQNPAPTGPKPGPVQSPAPASPPAPSGAPATPPVPSPKPDARASAMCKDLVQPTWLACD